MDTSDLAEFKSIMEQGAERYRADQARIAALEAQLAASEARCAELDGAARADEQRLRGAAECAGVGWFGCDTPEVLADTIGALRVDLAAALARAEEAERQLAAIEDARCRHGWKGSKPESTSRIETPCPACGLKSLFIAAGNHLTCANLSCREPSPESWCAAAIARAEEAERVALRSDGRELCWCDVHDEPVIRYGDGSWRCWWQLVVETSDQSQCKVAPLRQAMKEGRGDE